MALRSGFVGISLKRCSAGAGRGLWRQAADGKRSPGLRNQSAPGLPLRTSLLGWASPVIIRVIGHGTPPGPPLGAPPDTQSRLGEAAAGPLSVTGFGAPSARGQETGPASLQRGLLANIPHFLDRGKSLHITEDSVPEHSQG